MHNFREHVDEVEKIGRNFMSEKLLNVLLRTANLSEFLLLRFPWN